MVKATEGVSVELARLIRSQERDARSRHARRGGPETGIDLDRLAGREPCPIRLREGRPQNFLGHRNGLCPECGGLAGPNEICLPCDGGAEGRNLRGRPIQDIDGPTTYSPPAGLKGGVGR
jgi:hypothetical protein